MVRMPLRKLKERRKRKVGRWAVGRPAGRPAKWYTAFISKFHQIGPSTAAVRGEEEEGEEE